MMVCIGTLEKLDPRSEFTVSRCVYALPVAPSAVQTDRRRSRTFHVSTPLRCSFHAAANFRRRQCQDKNLRSESESLKVGMGIFM